MRTVIKKWGNSAAVRVPASILEEMHLAVGAEIDVRVENGCILVKPLTVLQFDLDQLLEKILPENLHEESDFGPALGNETF